MTQIFAVWHRILAAALRSLVMLPSLVHSMLSSLSLDKHVHDVVLHEERTMDDFLREVRRSFEGPLQAMELLSMSGKLQQQFRAKLQDSNNCMLPSYNHTLPTGHERGTFLALDVGGSTLRVALVELAGDSTTEERMRLVQMKSYPVNNVERALEGTAFFDWIAGKIEQTLAEEDIKAAVGSSTIYMGLSWSFPVEQTSIRSGRLLHMGKGFQATVGVLGDDLRELIMQACDRRNLNVSLEAIVNDSSATLLSRAYQDPSTRMALILGTGMNAAVHIPVSALGKSKFGVRPQSWHDKATHVIVNTELSMFGKNILTTSRWDDYLNLMHMRPDFQPFEYLITGRYIGEIVRLILVEAIQTAGLFGGEVPEKLLEPYALDTSILAIIEADDTATLSKSCKALQSWHPLRSPPTYSDLLFVRQICRLVSERAAAYLATGIHALWSLMTQANGLTTATVGPVTIGCNGAVIEKYPNFKENCQRRLDELTHLSGAQARAVVLEPALESAIFGAAVAVCCSE